MHPEIYVPVLLLLLVANGSPILAARLLGPRWQRSVDGGRLAYDGRPWLGPSKTWRGIIAALISTTLCSWALGWGWTLGLGFAALAMAGDLAASLAKRRLGLAPSSKATGLDQVPESLLPLLALPGHWLAPLDVLALLLLFLVLERALSLLLYRLGVRKRPY